MSDLLVLGKSAKASDLPRQTLNLVYPRASQINDCSYCVDMYMRDLKEGGERDERL
jgi:AhpD family alkylhydroperoxidase